MRALLLALVAGTALACATPRRESAAVSLRVAGFVQLEGIT